MSAYRDIPRRYEPGSGAPPAVQRAWQEGVNDVGTYLAVLRERAATAVGADVHPQFVLNVVLNALDVLSGGLNTNIHDLLYEL